jgi:ubiquinone/menaquinone biosynthesis C-methylase UbiE
VLVREQYASEAGLEARRSIYGEITGPDPREVAFAAVAELRPSSVLEVGCGPGEASERITRELGASVVAIDISERLVELAMARGVDARVGDVQTLPLEDGSVDCALAAWVLFHVPDLDRALAELVRVLRPDGRLVAVTNAADHLTEVWPLVSAPAQPTLSFRSENGEGVLRRRFGRVERRDGSGTVTLQDAESVRTYLGSSVRGRPYVESVPELTAPLVARRRTTVFVADK